MPLHRRDQHVLSSRLARISFRDDGTGALSPFLRGVTVPDPITGEPRTFNDLRRRRADLEALVCPPEPTVSVRHGISRVH